MGPITPARDPNHTHLSTFPRPTHTRECGHDEESAANVVIDHHHLSSGREEEKDWVIWWSWHTLLAPTPNFSHEPAPICHTPSIPSVYMMQFSTEREAEREGELEREQEREWINGMCIYILYEI